MGEVGSDPTDRKELNMAKHGKKYREAAALIDREQVYQPLEAAESRSRPHSSPSTRRSRRTSS